MKYLPFSLSIFFYLAILLWGAIAWLLAGASTDEQWQQYQAKIQNLDQLIQEETLVNLSISSILDSSTKSKERELPMLLKAQPPLSEEGLFSRILGRELHKIHSPGALLYAFREGSDSGQILWQKDMDTARPTASMTKVMSLLLVQEFLRDYAIDPEQIQRIPRLGTAAQRPFDASVAGLRTGLELSWKQLLTYGIVASGNDAVYALAILSERARSEESLPEQKAVDAFVARMQRRAAELNLSSANFVDPDGWSEEDIISPLDMVRLAIFYTESFPEILPLHRQQSVELIPALGEKKGRIKRNTNILLPLYSQVDGLKTGFTYEAGFNFCATAQRGDWRYIVVVMGLQDESITEGLRRRAAEAEVLLNWAMSHFSSLDFSKELGTENSVSTPTSSRSESHLEHLSYAGHASYAELEQNLYWKNLATALQDDFERTLHSHLFWHKEPGTGLLLHSADRSAAVPEELEKSKELAPKLAPKLVQKSDWILRYQINEEQLRKWQESQNPYLGTISVEYGSKEWAYLLLPAQQIPEKSFTEKLLRLRWLLIDSLWPIIKEFFVDLRPYGIWKLSQKGF